MIINILINMMKTLYLMKIRLLISIIDNELYYTNNIEGLLNNCING